MATYSDTRVALHGLTRTEGHAAGAKASVGSRLLALFRETTCGLHGHDNLMQFDKKRVYLLCASCGHESPGWELTQNPPRVRMRGDAQRHVLRRPHLIGPRRIA